MQVLKLILILNSKVNYSFYAFFHDLNTDLKKMLKCHSNHIKNHNRYTYYNHYCKSKVLRFCLCFDWLSFYLYNSDLSEMACVFINKYIHTHVARVNCKSHLTCRDKYIQKSYLRSSPQDRKKYIKTNHKFTHETSFFTLL